MELDYLSLDQTRYGRERPTWIKLLRELNGISQKFSCVTIQISSWLICLDKSDRFDLILSGHTHGGQVNLPLIGPLYVNTKTGGAYTNGFYEINDRKIYITRGIGGSIRLRLNSIPEIVVMEFT